MLWRLFLCGGGGGVSDICFSVIRMGGTLFVFSSSRVISLFFVLFSGFFAANSSSCLSFSDVLCLLPYSGISFLVIR